LRTIATLPENIGFRITWSFFFFRNARVQLLCYCGVCKWCRKVDSTQRTVFILEYSEIAKRLGISEESARDIASRGLRRIERAGLAEDFATLVCLTQIKAAGDTYIKCGSIECRPEKWLFYNV
jgi:hypothetical protein